ncbi:MAG: anti-sigma factor family protein [Myxococcota bacterium]
MYTCKDSISLLMTLLDGEVSAEEERNLEEHLQACPPCVEFMRTYRATPAMCRTALAAKMPEELCHRLTEFLRSKCKK